jgi:dTDP-L-rhamnose 4-epimerase
MKRILITGGAGFIGSNLVQSLHRQGYFITVLDNLSEQVHSADPDISVLYQSIKDKVEFIRGSVCVKDDLLKAIQCQDVIVHFAAETGTGQSMYEVDRYVSSNIGATGLLLDLLGNTKHEVKRMVIASSRSIYGEGKYLRADGSPVFPKHRNEADLKSGQFEVQDPEGGGALKVVATDEDSKIHPSSVYGITKQVQEQLVMTVCPLLGIEPVALRYQNVYGPGQSLVNPYTGILSIFSNLIMSGKPINIFEDGRESRDFVFIDDVVQATVLAIAHPDAGHGIFNVGSGVPTDVKTVAGKLMECFEREVPVTVSGNFRLGDIRHNFAAMDRIKQRLGYEPKVSFAEGIAQFVAWAKSLGPKESRYEQSLQEMKERGLMK